MRWMRTNVTDVPDVAKSEVRHSDPCCVSNNGLAALPFGTGWRGLMAAFSVDTATPSAMAPDSVARHSWGWRRRGRCSSVKAQQALRNVLLSLHNRGQLTSWAR
jgi:hypothetical protein